MNKIIKKQKNKFDISWYTKLKVKTFLQKVAESFMLIIVIMPLAGIFMIVSQTIAKFDSDTNKFSIVLKQVAGIFFSNTGLWFGLSFIVGFAKNKGNVVMAMLFAYIGTLAFIGVFTPIDDKVTTTFDIWFWKNLNINSLLSKQFGYFSFNMGPIGGILLAVLIIYFDKWSQTFKFPKAFQIFAGNRFIIFVSPILTIFSAILFILIWPLINIILTYVCFGIQWLPNGLDSFLFRTIQRIVSPFGTGMLWTGPFWYTPIGADLAPHQSELLFNWLINQLNIDSKDDLWNKIKGLQGENLYSSTIDFIKSINLDSQFVDKFRNGTENLWSIKGDNTLSFAVVSNNILSIQDCWDVGLRLTRFTTGGFVNSLFILPTIGITFLLMHEKEERSNKIGIYLVASLTAFFIGITEPLEFLFCFLAPKLFFGVYSGLNGIAALITSLLHIQIATSFSTGAIDFIFGGVLPYVNGQENNFYMLLLIGICFIPVTWASFYFYLKKSKLLNKIYDTNLNKPYILKANVFNLFAYFDGYSNIKQLEVKDDHIIIDLKRKTDLSFFDNFFISISKTDKKYVLKINPINKESVLKFIEVYEYKKN